MVFDSLIAIFLKYGLLGLLFSSFASSLVFIPAYSNFLIPVYVNLDFNPWHVLIVISAGSIVGGIVNFYIGLFGSKYILHKEVKNAKKWLNKWGDMSVFIVNLIPIFPADIVNTLVGFFRMDFRIFLVGMSAGKIIQFALLIFGTEIILKFISVI